MVCGQLININILSFIKYYLKSNIARKIIKSSTLHLAWKYSHELNGSAPREYQTKKLKEHEWYEEHID